MNIIHFTKLLKTNNILKIMMSKTKKINKEPVIGNTLKNGLFDYKNLNDLADVLLNKTLINVNNKKYRPCEIEFYYKGTGHEDLYTHCSNEQRMKCKFYFHKYKTGSYKSGTYKGMDITMSPDDDAYFGILIRSLCDQENNEFIEGPCKSVNKILEQYGFTEVKEFVNGKQLPLDIYDTSNKFYVINTNDLKQEKIYKGPRIGLSDKYPDYQNINYRYAIMINKIKKQRKTFIDI